MTKKLGKHGLKKAVASHGRTRASSLNGCPRTNADAATPPTKPDVHQQETAQTSGEDRRFIFEVYADVEGCLKLATTSVIRDGEKVIIDAVAPLVQEHNKKYLGSRSNLHAGRKNSSNRKQHSDSNASTSFSKHHDPSSKRPPALSPDFVEASSPEDKINTPDADSEDDHLIEDSDHEDDDDGEPLLEIESEQFDTLTAGDVAALEDYYSQGVCQVGQLMMRKVLKGWVKLKQPKKQSTYPYNGRKTREDLEQYKIKYGKVDKNPGRLTAPPWWPKQEGWPIKGCRHREPDHLRKPERTMLALRLLSLTGCDETFTVEKLLNSTKDIQMTFHQRQMLKQLYDVRKKQQAFQRGEIDASTTIPVYRPKGQPSQKKRRVNPNQKRSARKVKQERRDTSAAVKQSTQGTPASMPESVQSSSPPITSLATAKIETQRPTVDYENYVQAKYAPRNESVHFEPMMPDPGVFHGTMYASSNPFQPNMATLPQEIPPFSHQTSPMEAPTASTPSDRGRMPVRSGNGYPRRPTSVCKQNSPSYQDWTVPRDVGWNLNDDLFWGVRPPLTSSGYPTTGLSIALDDPRNHQHGGLPPDEQQRLCMRHNCSNYRTLEQHQQGARRNGWLPFNDHQVGMPDSHGLDVGAIDELMRHEDFTPDSSLSRSFGQQ
ncbi:MAG: hypothetical protein Q9199_000709 [Rusavskia elegans]